MTIYFYYKPARITTHPTEGPDRVLCTSIRQHVTRKVSSIYKCFISHYDTMEDNIWFFDRFRNIKVGPSGGRNTKTLVFLLLTLLII